MDIFASLSALPMSVVNDERLAFDDPNYLFEFRFTGIRALAYLSDTTVLVNRMGMPLTHLFPELAYMHAHIRNKCILDGELVVVGAGTKIHDLEQLNTRLRQKHKLTVAALAEIHPATFVAFDLLYLDDRQITHLPLIERRRLLEENIRQKNRKFCVTRPMAAEGCKLFARAASFGLDGIMAKKLASPYHMGQSTNDWHSIFNWQEAEMLICGYIRSAAGKLKIVLGSCDSRGELQYRGHAVPEDSGVTGPLSTAVTTPNKPFTVGLPFGNESVTWLNVPLPANVRYLPFQGKYLRAARVVNITEQQNISA